jgi:ankyrin repeat protein
MVLRKRCAAGLAANHVDDVDRNKPVYGTEKPVGLLRNRCGAGLGAGHAGVARRLLAAGAGLARQRPSDKATPLHIAAAAAHPDMVCRGSHALARFLARVEAG